MRILVHEFVTGGGLAGRAVPASLAREGAAMRNALIADLAAIGRHQIVATIDSRFPLAAPTAVEVVTLTSGSPSQLNALIASADAVWLVAPETDRCLERLAALVEKQGKTLLGPDAAAIGSAADKAGLPLRLAQRRVPHPLTLLLQAGADVRRIARDLHYPVVVKPGRGAGCEGVCLARNASELRRAVEFARRVKGRSPLLIQRYVPGVPASVSLLVHGGRTRALAVNAQMVRPGKPFSYHGGRTPLEHPLTARAIDVARRACGAFPGLRGYIGVDVILADDDAIVIEVNPRLTTSYLGVRLALEGNVAAMVIAACGGTLPRHRRARRPPVRFTTTGRIAS
jgi:tyramine---L-glutamate ligase